MLGLAGCNLSRGRADRGRDAPINHTEGKSGEMYTVLLQAGAHFAFVSNVFEIIQRKRGTPSPFLTGCSDKSGALDGILLPVQGRGAV